MITLFKSNLDNGSKKKVSQILKENSSGKEISVIELLNIKLEKEFKSEQ